MQSHNHSHHHHDHDHDHSHKHHSHAHGAEGNLWFAFILNFLFAVVELVGGVLTNSIAIQSDALHDFGDALSIGFVLLMEKLSKLGPRQGFSYGYTRLRIFGTLFTGGVLVAGSVFMLVRGIDRLLNPEPVQVNGMLALAVVGVVVNLVAYLRMRRGTSMQERVIILHLLEDAIGWIVVFLGALILYFGGPSWLDPVMSLGLSVWVIYRVWSLLKESLTLLMQAEPHAAESVIVAIKSVPGVMDVHHLHLWSLDGERHILNAHVVVDTNSSWADIALLKKHISEKLQSLGRYESTLEFESENETCLSPSHQA